MTSLNKWRLFGLTALVSAGLSAGLTISALKGYLAEREKAREVIAELYERETDTFPLELGYQVHSSNSSLKDARVVLLGETHLKDDKKHSEFFRHYIKDNDIVLLESVPKAENLEAILDDCESNQAIKKACEHLNYNPELKTIVYKMAVLSLHPELYGIKQAGKKPKIRGADDMKAYFESGAAETRFMELKEEDSLEERARRLDEIIQCVMKRDNSMFASIQEALKETPGKVYLIVGKGHIDQANTEVLRVPDSKDWLVNKIKSNGANYVAYIPDRTKDNQEETEQEEEIEGTGTPESIQAQSKIKEQEFLKFADKVAKARKRFSDYEKRFAGKE